MKLLSLALLFVLLAPVWAKEKLIRAELQAHPLLKKRIASYIEQLGGEDQSGKKDHVFRPLMWTHRLD